MKMARHNAALETITREEAKEAEENMRERERLFRMLDRNLPSDTTRRVLAQMKQEAASRLNQRLMELHPMRHHDIPKIPNAWKPVFRLLQNPYWGRVWIIQEVILGNNPILHCGRRSMSLEGFEEALNGWKELGLARSWLDLRDGYDKPRPTAEAPGS
jgi:hypothetical protein